MLGDYNTLENNGRVDDPSNLVQIGCTPPDFDCDGDVDLADYLVLQQGFSGPGVPTPDPRTDLDHDGDTDLADLVTFQAAFTGAR